MSFASAEFIHRRIRVKDPIFKRQLYFLEKARCQPHRAFFRFDLRGADSTGAFSTLQRGSVAVQAPAVADDTAGDEGASKGCAATGDPGAILGGLFIGIF